MENNKKKWFGPRNDGERKEGGQRISVRPGNFTPPAERRESAPTRPEGARPSAEGNRPQSEGQREGGNGGQSRNKNRHHHHKNRRGGENRPAGENRRNEGQSNRPEAQNRPNGQSRGQNQNAQQRDGRDANRAPAAGGGRDARRPQHHDKDRHAARGQSARSSSDLSATLRRELDEEFGLTTSLFAPAAKKKEPTPGAAVDTDEFAVDIATAAYLVEDVPCGFPLPDGKSVEVVGVRFRNAGKMYFFAPNGEAFRIGEKVLVDTARGPEIGDIVMLKRKIAEKDVVQPLRPVLRRATAEDAAHEQENRRRESEALKVCAEKIKSHGLDMHLVDAQYTFDNSKLLFYFTSEGRVDFRDLVRDLAGVFHTRIELRQIGIRDESRLIGGLGMCGRPFCCSTYLSDFGQVSIKMAKEQGLSINASKISGCCGRLMCCLRYEHETYAAEAKLTPKKDTPVETPDGRGVVVDSTPIAGTVKVRLDAAPEEAPKVYHRDSVTVLSKKKEPAPAQQPEQTSEDAQTAENAPTEA